MIIGMRPITYKTEKTKQLKCKPESFVWDITFYAKIIRATNDFELNEVEHKIDKYVFPYMDYNYKKNTVEEETAGLLPANANNQKKILNLVVEACGKPHIYNYYPRLKGNI